MMAQVTTLRPTPAAETLTERDLRVQLAACYRLVAHFGMDDLVYTHISARVPGHPDQFLINPYGLMFEEITASSLVKVDHQGRILDDSPHAVNLAGIIIHSAVLAGRPEVNCVLHTHTRAGIAISCLEEGLLPINQFSLMFYDRLAYHDYEGIATDFEECERLKRDLGDKDALILRNHGLLTVGRTVPEAFSVAYYLEQSCRVQLDLMASGGKLRTLPREVCEHTAKQYGASPTPRGEREWPALLRLLDAKYPGYRD